ncbi:ATP-binding protein [Brevundimonas sp. 2R-24]|uniref:histidine kinase n=1 Tax=Peiella sedimenti TaxID=3061083 RepID=A0ABT8SL24_9CAUL|nr:ATP-binding protein [Caulobacteraceae bacterium XZ-24]
MLLQGEVNWALVFGLVALVMSVLGLMAMAAAGRWAARSRNATRDAENAAFRADTAERRLSETLQAIPVALVETDASGKFTFANRAAQQLLGRRDAELLGLRFHSATWGITYPDGRQIPPDLLPNARALRGQTVRGFQQIMANPNTRKRMLVSVTAEPIENVQGEIIGSSAALVEIEGLAHPTGGDLASATRRVFDAAASLLAVVTLEGEIVDINRTALERLGGELEDWTGKDMAQATGAGGRLRDALMAAARSGQRLDEAVEANGIAWRVLPLKLDGAEAVDALLLAGDPLVEAKAPEADPEHLAQLDELNRTLTAVRAERDAATAAAEEARSALAQMETARRRADEALQASQRMEQVGRLAGGVTHDFHNMLKVVVDALETLLRQADDPARVRRLAEAALAAGRRGERVTREMLAFSRAQDADAPAIDAAAVVRGLEPALRRRASGASVRVQAVAGPLNAHVDPVQMEAALEALVDNAAQALNPGGGHVEVRLDEVTLEAGETAGLPAGRYLRLAVADDGRGMAADELARAQEPFFTTREGAAGLGLSQALGFARQAGGALTLNSRPGEGTTARIYLPLPDRADGGGERVADVA